MWCVRLEDPSVLAGEAQPPGGDQPDGRQGPSFGAGGSVTSVPGGWGSRGSPARESMAEPSDRGPGSRRVAGCPAWRPTFQVEPSARHARAAVRASVLVHPTEPSRPTPSVRRARRDHQDIRRATAGRSAVPTRTAPLGRFGTNRERLPRLQPLGASESPRSQPRRPRSRPGFASSRVGGRSRRGIVVAPLERRTVGWPT